MVARPHTFAAAVFGAVLCTAPEAAAQTPGGAAQPDNGTAAHEAALPGAFPLAARRASHWAWQPLADAAPPAAAGHGGAVDALVGARLAAAGLAPSPRADRAVLLRRASFDLLGLPPAPAELGAFLADRSPDAWERAVDRLLASPHFGERWARHWLDLVRYAETLGHEYDFAIPEAWRYRDWVIRALNQDLPYDRFVIEHVAGDLVDPPRLDPDTGADESVIGTCFLWFGDQTHSPVDIKQAYADRVDNQIDVLSKTFLGVTVACARCHDHKFDAISARDYYAIAGILKSSRFTLQVVDPPAPTAAAAARVDAAARAVEQQACLDLDRAVGALDRELLAAGRVAERIAAEKPKNAEARRAIAAAEAAALDAALDAARVLRLAEHLERERPARDPRHPLHAFARALGGTAPEGTPRENGAPTAAKETADAAQEASDRELADFARGTFGGWCAEGPAFGSAPASPGDVLRPTANATEAAVLEGAWAHSGQRVARLAGSLVSPTFDLDRRYLHVLACGRDRRVNVVIEGFHLIRDPIYGSLKLHVDHREPRWRTIDLDMWRGRRAYVQLQDFAVSDPADDVHDGRRWDPDGWLAVQRVVLSDRAAAPEAALRAPAPSPQPTPGAAAAAAEFRAAARSALAAWRAHRAAGSTLGEGRAHLLGWLLARELCDPLAGADPAALDAFRAAAAAVPEPTVVPGTAEGTGEDEHVFVRGRASALGPVSARRFLEALGGQCLAPAETGGSGRLALAQWLVDPSNPLTPRVAVNRVWHHLFGRGLAPTVDNFGVLGEPPTHPELLDWLASSLRDDGWSLKRLIRRVVLSETYCQSSDPRPDAEELDPKNELWHRQQVRRLEGEAIRDAILAVAGTLDRAMYGPGVPVHLTPFMDGRGRPRESGPLDGAGRRSVYLEVRRNFLSPFFLVFDAPIPFTTRGQRGTSNVPAQALALLNDPFVLGQARTFAARLPENAGDEERIVAMYERALGRAPEPGELDAAREFVSVDGEGSDAWTELAHVLFNAKDFVWLR